MTNTINLQEPGGFISPTGAKESGESIAELTAAWRRRFRAPGRSEAEAVRLAGAEAARVAERIIGQVVAEKPSDDARASWALRYRRQGKSEAEVARLVDLTFSPKSGTRFFSGRAVDLKEGGR